MTYLEQVVSTLMKDGHSPDEIIRAAERAGTGENIHDRIDMVEFARRVCMREDGRELQR